MQDSTILSSPTPVPAPNQNITPPPHSKKGVMWIIIGILGLAAVVVALFFLKSKNIIHKPTVKAASSASYFSIVSVSPSDSSTDNDPDSPITVTFTQAVTPNTLRGYFTVSPMVPGTFTQGSTPDQVIFTPKFSFKSGTSVNVILNQGFESVSGAKFTSDYSFNFYTKPLDDAVIFDNNGLFPYLTSVTPNTSINFNLQVGTLVDPNGTITLYKGTVDQLLNSLVYSNQTTPGSAYIDQEYINNPVDTFHFQKISSTSGLNNGSAYAFNQGPGLYYIEADSKNNPAGFTWVNVTDQGLLTRQDDQQINIATQNILSGDTNEDVKVTLYNLESKPTPIGSTEITGTGSLPIAYPKAADLLVGETSEGVILAPLSVPYTQSDIRVVSNLSDLGKIFLYTDRPTYQASDTIQFSGVVRLDNDAQYALPNANSMVRVWIPDPNNSTTNIFDQKFPVSADGVFSGHLIVPDELTPGILNNTSVTMYAQLTTDTTQASSLRSYTTFDVVNGGDEALLQVNFDKSDYNKGDIIVAHIIGVDGMGKPLSHQAVTYEEYDKNYYESDPTSVANFGTDWGELNGSDQTVTLDGNGHADITLNSDPGDTSSALTLEASANINGVKTYGAKTILVRQGNVVLSFGPSRDTYHSGDTTITRVYARDLQGNALANLSLNYQIYTSQYDDSSHSYQETTSVTGSATTDSNGFALIQQAVTTDQPQETIRISAQDSNGNTVNAEQTFNFVPADTPVQTLYYHDPTLNNLDVATDKTVYNVGDTAHLIINSPFNQNVWVTYERGRVYHSEWLTLQQGSNNYQIPITEQLSPSFNIVFSYFRSGTLNDEGLSIQVADPSKNLAVMLAPDKNSYTPNSKAALTISTKDNTGNAIPADVSVTVLSDNIFNLRNVLPSGDINWYYFTPRDDTTNFSSSTLGIGTGDGCGGGGDDIQYVPNRLGTTVYWNPNLSTDQNGQTQISIPMPTARGSYRVLVRAWTNATAVGDSDSIITVQ